MPLSSFSLPRQVITHALDTKHIANGISVLVLGAGERGRVSAGGGEAGVAEPCLYVGFSFAPACSIARAKVCRRL